MRVDMTSPNGQVRPHYLDSRVSAAACKAFNDKRRTLSVVRFVET
jgi:hypothetical protein